MSAIDEAAVIAALPLAMTAIPSTGDVEDVRGQSRIGTDQPSEQGAISADQALSARRSAAGAENDRRAARMKGPQASVPPPAAYTMAAAMTVDAAAHYTGFGRSRLYEAMAEGRITARKAGRRTLFMRADLDRLLANLPPAPIRSRKSDAV